MCVGHGRKGKGAVPKVGHLVDEGSKPKSASSGECTVLSRGNLGMRTTDSPDRALAYVSTAQATGAASEKVRAASRRKLRLAAITPRRGLIVTPSCNADGEARTVSSVRLLAGLQVAIDASLSASVTCERVRAAGVATLF